MDENDYEQSRDVDRKEAREQERLRVARRMLAKGLDPATISEFTGLTAEDVQALEAEGTGEGEE